MHGIDTGVDPGLSTGPFALAGAYAGERIDQYLQKRRNRQELLDLADFIIAAANRFEVMQPGCALGVANEARRYRIALENGAIPEQEYRLQMTSLYQALPRSAIVQTVWHDIAASDMKGTRPFQRPRAKRNQSSSSFSGVYQIKKPDEP